MKDSKIIAERQEIIINLLHEVLTKINVLTNKPPSKSPFYDTNIYGDFTWFCQLCPGIPASTLRKRSASGAIPGYRKIGNRVLYHRAKTISWIESHAVKKGKSD